MKKMSYEKKKSRVGFWFILFWLVGFIYFFIIPFISSFIYSISDVTFGQNGIEMQPYGITNYINVISSRPGFIRGLWETLLAIVWQSPLVVIFSIFIAIMLNTKFPGKTLFRAIFFLPVIIASGTLMSMLSESSSGFSASISSASSTLFSGIKFMDILLSSGVPIEAANAIMTIVNGIFGVVWRSGVQILLFLAGIQAIPASLYEAAKVEGATGWEIFWKITFPVISPTTILCVFFTIVEMANDSSLGVVNFIRRETANAKISTSSTMSVIWFVVIILLTGLIFLLSRRHIYYLDDKG